MTLTMTHHINPPLLAYFVLESSLEYQYDHDMDGRLACWQRGEGDWAIAWHDRTPAGIACIVTLDDGPYAGQRCLYWLEVLPSFQKQGIGQALLHWALPEDALFVIAATPESLPFYRHCLPTHIEEAPRLIIVGADAVAQHQQKPTSRASLRQPRSIGRPCMCKGALQ